MLRQQVIQQFRFFTVCMAVILTAESITRAAIFRWDNGQLIPGTEGITPGPGVQLANRQLEYASLSSLDLSGADFNFSELSYADLTDSNLTNASFYMSTLTNANFTGAIVDGAYFSDATGRGFTKEQLYSTASYEQENLRGVELDRNDLSGWNLSGQDLTTANLSGSTLTNVDLSGAIVTRAFFYNTTSNGFTKEQLYSTASYQQRNLQGIGLGGNDLSGWDLTRQDLTDASFYQATLSGTDFAGAIVNRTDFYETNFTKEQLYSTASYQQKDLKGIQFGALLDGWNNIAGWDLSGQNLTDAYLGASTVNTNLTAADLRRAAVDLSAAIASNAIRPDGIILGLELARGDRLMIRDDDGVDPSPICCGPRPPIPISVRDHVAMTDGGILRLVFEADHWDSLISFQSGIPVQLGGTLELTFASGTELSAQVGRTFRIFDWTGVTPIDQFVVTSPYTWDLSHLYTFGEVTRYLSMSSTPSMERTVSTQIRCGTSRSHCV